MEAMEAHDLSVYFIEKLEMAGNIEELDKAAMEIKEVVELLRCYYVSNKLKFTTSGQPEDILNAKGKKAMQTM